MSVSADDLTNARRHTVSARDRLVGVLSELRGVSCDFEVAARYLAGDDRPHGWVEVSTDMDQALTAVVDLLTTAHFGLGAIDRTKPEPGC